MSTEENNFDKLRSIAWSSPLAVGTIALAAAGAVVAQGHYEANPKQSIKIERSTDIKMESKEFEVPVEVQMEYKTTGCEAKLSLEYFQRGENAQVNSTLTNEQCGASYGSYKVQVRYRGDDQELKTRDYEETWRRDDNEPLETTRQYFVGEDVDLVRVKTRSLTCTCAAEEGTEVPATK